MAQAPRSSDTAQAGSRDAGAAQQGSPSTATAQAQSRDGHGGRHVHHGRTPAAWTGVAIAGAGFLLGGFALVDGPNWVLFWIAAALCVVALIVARVMQVMGYGAD